MSEITRVPLNSSASYTKRKSTQVDKEVPLSKWKKRKKSIQRIRKSLTFRTEYLLPKHVISRSFHQLNSLPRRELLLTGLYSEDGKIDEDYFDEMLFIERPVYTQMDFDMGFERGGQSPQSLYDFVKSNVSKCKCNSSTFHKFIKSFFPFIAIMKDYNVNTDLAQDIIAGLTVGILHIPQGMAYGQLTSLPPVYGLYCSFFPVVLYFFFGTSKHISLGTFAVVSLMVGSIVQKGLEARGLEFLEWNTTDTSGTNNSLQLVNNFPEVLDVKLKLAMSVTLMVGVIQFLLGVMQMGFLTVYMSDPLISGFTTGAAFHVLTSQIQHIFGINMKQYSGNFRLVYSYRDIIMNLPQTHFLTFMASIVCILLLVIVKECINTNPQIKRKLKMPVPIDLIVVILGTFVSYFVQLEEVYEIQIVGDIPIGIPAPNLEAFYFLPEVTADCFAIAIVAFAISVSMAKIFARKHNYEVDSNQELLAYGLCNIISSFFYTFASGVSLSRSLVQENIGGKTQITGLVSSALVVFVLLVVGPFFRTLPNCVLGSIILVALKGMFMQFLDLKVLWYISFIDFAVWLVTFTATFLLDVDLGLLIGVAFALSTVIFRSQRPYACLMGQVPRTDIYRDINMYSIAQEIPNIKIFRFDSALFFANVEYFKKTLYKMTVDPNDLKNMQKKIDKKKLKEEMLRIESKEQLDNENTVSIPENNYMECHDGGTVHSSETDRASADLSLKVIGSSVDLVQIKELPTLTDIHFIILDCSTMSYVDSMGVNVLLQIMLEFRAFNVNVYLTQCKSGVREMFELTNFYKTNNRQHVFITIHDAVVSAQLQQCRLMKKDKKPTHCQLLEQQLINNQMSRAASYDTIRDKVIDE